MDLGIEFSDMFTAFQNFISEYSTYYIIAGGISLVFAVIRIVTSFTGGNED